MYEKGHRSKVKVKGQGQRSRSEVKVKGHGQRSKVNDLRKRPEKDLKKKISRHF